MLLNAPRGLLEKKHAAKLRAAKFKSAKPEPDVKQELAQVQAMVRSFLSQADRERAMFAEIGNDLAISIS